MQKINFNKDQNQKDDDETFSNFEKEYFSEKFEQMNFCEEVLGAIFALGYEKPRQIQQIVIKQINSFPEKDVIIQANSGEGKTLCVSSTFINDYIVSLRTKQQRKKILFVYSSINLCIQQFTVIKQFCDQINEKLDEKEKISSTIILKKFTENFDDDDEEQSEQKLIEKLNKNPLINIIQRQIQKDLRELCEDYLENDIIFCTLGKISGLFQYVLDKEKSFFQPIDFQFDLLSIDEIDKIFSENKQVKNKQISLLKQLQIICQFIKEKGKIFSYSATISKKLFQQITDQNYKLFKPDTLCYCYGINEKIMKTNLQFFGIKLNFSDFEIKDQNKDQNKENKEKLFNFLLKLINHFTQHNQKTIFFIKDIEMIDDIFECLKQISQMDDFDEYPEYQKYKQLFSEVCICHSKRNQKQNQIAIEKFQLSAKNILLTTEGQAGRGIDIQDTQNSVICFYPKTIEDFLQMSGRAGRKSVKGNVFQIFFQNKPTQILQDGFANCCIKFNYIDFQTYN